MTKEVVVEWFTNKSNGGMQVGPRQEPRKFKSRTAAVRFVMEELEESRRHNVRMIVFSTLFECTPHASDYETFSSASSGRERNPIDSSSFPSAAYSNQKFGLTSAPRLPQALRTNRSSMSDSLISSAQPSPLIAIEWLQRKSAQ